MTCGRDAKVPHAPTPPHQPRHDPGQPSGYTSVVPTLKKYTEAKRGLAHVATTMHLQAKLYNAHHRLYCCLKSIPLEGEGVGACVARSVSHGTKPSR